MKVKIQYGNFYTRKCGKLLHSRSSSIGLHPSLLLFMLDISICFSMSSLTKMFLLMTKITLMYGENHSLFQNSIHVHFSCMYNVK